MFGTTTFGDICTKIEEKDLEEIFKHSGPEIRITAIAD